MASLKIIVKADNRGGRNTLLVLQALVNYQRIIRSGGQDANGNTIASETGPRERSFTLPEAIDSELELSDYAEDTLVDVAITDPQGSKLISFRGRKPTRNDRSETWKLTIELSSDQVRRLIEATKPNAPATMRTLSATAEFRPTIDIDIAYSGYSLTVSPVEKGKIAAQTLKDVFGGESGASISAKTDKSPNALLSAMKATTASSVSVSIQGQFSFTLPARDKDDAWIWVLSGPYTFVGLVEHKAEEASLRRVLWLPLIEGDRLEGDASREDGSTVIPVDPSEQELIESPELFADDPGTRCKPFHSPFRIVGERSFQTVLRVTQPEISTDAAAPKPPRPVDISQYYEIDTSEFVMAASLSTNTDANVGRAPATNTKGLSKFVVSNLANLKTRLTTLVNSDSEKLDISPEAEVLAEERAEVLKNSSGRKVLTAETSLDWEDNTPLQAASLSYGHILDYRVRWRNNGYSLGNVLYSLALAPRQTKSIITVQSEISDRAVRSESTTVTDEIAQGVDRDYGYSDAVQAGLSEWSKGGSKSKTTGVAGGIGFAMGPVVLGGGAAHGRAESSSWQQGGRKVTALEEQQLRDSIRQYGESVRKLETVVVQEQSQQETTQAVSETVRNPNYCHSLTVVYHEILRHLRIDTEVVGARECVFVPLPIKAFTWSRMIRWRDSITRALMRPRLRWVMPYLEDIRSNFVNSDIPAGMRADQPIRFLSGSIYLRMAVERPLDPEDEDTFDRARWLSLAPFVSRPVREIYDILKRNADQKDTIFQRDYASGIAAKWVDLLTLSTDGRQLTGADFTMATKYRYGRTVRVDFTYVPDTELTRNDLKRMNVGVEEDADLTPGTIANAQRLVFKYTTEDFERRKSSSSGQDDLINIGDGRPKTDGADFSFPTDKWEENDQRETIRREANKLRKHLNEHLEYYHKYLWWNMDRDKLYMLLDTIYAISVEDGRSVASVVERNPIAILGNSLVYRVAGGAHLGIDGHDTSQALNEYYRDSVTRSEPIRVSLPTAGVYAQALLDDCEACEEHFGSTEWILDDKEPELAALDPSMLTSRRADTPDLTPTVMPSSIINLQNAPNVPAPNGFASALNSLSKSDSFRDMAGLEGTQANAKSAMESAASLASDFGAKAVDLEKTRIAAKVAKEKLGMIEKAEKKGQLSKEDARKASKKTIEQSLQTQDKELPTDREGLKDIAEQARAQGVDITAEKGSRTISVSPVNTPEFASYEATNEPEVESLELDLSGDEEVSEVIPTVGEDEEWIIIVAGYNYASHRRGTTTYGTYARNRAALLLANNPAWQSNTKVRFLLINAGEGKAYVDNRSQGSLTKQGNWTEISELQFAKTKGAVPLQFRAISEADYDGYTFKYPLREENGLIAPPGFEDRPVFSIVNWYKLLRAFGRGAPGTVVEASILSHGYVWGPILLNSHRDPAFKNAADPSNIGNASRTRDPADVDGRADADFTTGTLSADDLTEIQKSFAPEGVIWLWGCSAFPVMKRMVRNLYGQTGFKSDGSTANTKTFRFDFESERNANMFKIWLNNPPFVPANGSVTDTTLGDFKSFLNSFTAITYPERLAKAFKVKTFATAVGTGSEADTGVRFPTHHVKPLSIYKKVVLFYKNYLKFKGDPEGRRYLDYKR